MMLIHGFVLLLTSLRLTSSWLCFKNDSFSLIFTSSALTTDRFDHILESEEVDTKILCAGTVIFNIVSSQFHIRFKSDELFATMAPTKNIIKRTTFFFGVDQKNNLNITHPTITPVVKIDFLCYSGDFCDRILLGDYVEQLRQFNFDPVINAFRPFVEVRQSKIQTCSIGEDFKAEPCESLSCSWLIFQTERRCNSTCDRFSSNVSSLEITSLADVFEGEELNYHNETCRKLNIVHVAFYASFVCYWDRCNNLDTKEKILETVYNQYAGFDVSLYSSNNFQKYPSSTVQSQYTTKTSTKLSTSDELWDPVTKKDTVTAETVAHSIENYSRLVAGTTKAQDRTNGIDLFLPSKSFLIFFPFISMQIFPPT